MPAISIIVPVYKVEEYLNRCVDSILQQTFQNFELILVNDGSPDGCGSICNEYAEKDKRVKVIHKKNGGLSDARNAGLRAAEGNYIGFVDSDDWIEPDMFELLYHLCVTLETDISTCLINHWYGDKQKKTFPTDEEVRILEGKAAIKELYDGKLTGFTAWNKLYKKEIFSNIRFPKGRVYEDAAVMYKAYGSADKIAFIKKPLYNYNHRESSITKSVFTEKRFDVAANYTETYSYMKKYFPEMCEKINSVYLETLKAMVLDIAHEKNLYKNIKYIRRVSSLAKKNNREFLRNKSLSLKSKVLVQILAWFPLLGIFLYKVRFPNT